MKTWKFDVIITMVFLYAICSSSAQKNADGWRALEHYFIPPQQYEGKMGSFRSPLLFRDGKRAQTVSDWKRRRAEILKEWMGLMGAWPPVIQRPRMDVL